MEIWLVIIVGIIGIIVGGGALMWVVRINTRPSLSSGSVEKEKIDLLTIGPSGFFLLCFLGVWNGFPMSSNRTIALIGIIFLAVAYSFFRLIRKGPLAIGGLYAENTGTGFILRHVLGRQLIEGKTMDVMRIFDTSPFPSIEALKAAVPSLLEQKKFTMGDLDSRASLAKSFTLSFLGIEPLSKDEQEMLHYWNSEINNFYSSLNEDSLKTNAR